MVNKSIVVRAGSGNDILRIQSLACKGCTHFNHAPEEYYIRDEADFTECRGKNKKAGDVREKIKSCRPNAQIITEKLDCAYKEQNDEHAHTQQEWNRYCEVKGLFQSIIFPQPGQE